MKHAYKSIVVGVGPRLVAAALIMVVLSGCIGGGDSKVATPTGPTLPTPTSTGENTDIFDDRVVTDPKRHYHHYWGEGEFERKEVAIFWYNQMQLEQDAFEPQSHGCTTVGHLYFDLEYDGDDATGAPKETPVNPNPNNGDEPKADTVFAGSVAIRVELVEKPQKLTGDLFLRYKPANLNFFQPDVGCGVKLTENTPQVINVGPKQSDPPHQWAVSRWQFELLAVLSPEQTQGTLLPAVAPPDDPFTFAMYAINGGERALDPAHPNLWGDGLTYDLGCAKAEDVERQYVVWAPESSVAPQTPVHKPPREPLANIAWQYGRIVPLKSMAVEVKLTYTNNAPGNDPVELWYFGGDANTYAPAPAKQGGAAGEYWIPDPRGIKADPPYEDETQWRFMLLPRPASGATAQPDPEGPTYSVAAFEGSYEVCAVAHRDPAAVFD